MTEPAEASGSPAILQDAAKRFLSESAPREIHVKLAPDLLERLHVLMASRTLTDSEPFSWPLQQR